MLDRLRDYETFFGSKLSLTSLPIMPLVGVRLEGNNANTNICTDC